MAPTAGRALQAKFGIANGSDAVASTSKLVASAPSASQLQKHIITVHPWDDPHVSPDASQRDGNFTSWVKRRVKVNIAGLPPDYPYQLLSSQNVRTFTYAMLPFVEFRGRGAPREDFGLPGDVYIDTTEGEEALYYCTVGPSHSRGSWERWEGTYPPPRHPYLDRENRYPRYLWVQPKTSTWASAMFLAGLTQEILHPKVTLTQPNAAETQRARLKADIVEMLANEHAPAPLPAKRGRPKIKQEPAESAGTTQSHPPRARKRKREVEAAVPPASAPVPVPQRRAAAAAAAKILLSAPQGDDDLPDESIESISSAPAVRHLPSLPSNNHIRRGAKHNQPTEPPPITPPIVALPQPQASSQAPLPTRAPLPRRKPTAASVSLNNALSQLKNVSEVLQNPQDLDIPKLEADVQKVVNSLEDSRRRVDAREKELREALSTKEKALSEAQTERAKLVAVVQTLQKEFAKIFIPAWKGGVNPSQLSNPRFNYENNISKVIPPRGPTELDKAKDRIAELERELERMRLQERVHSPQEKSARLPDEHVHLTQEDMHLSPDSVHLPQEGEHLTQEGVHLPQEGAFLPLEGVPLPQEIVPLPQESVHLPPPPDALPPPLVKEEPQLPPPLEFSHFASGETSRANSEVEILDGLELEYPE
ncbi:uncharacterized protein SCHCODRAFT_02548794 [Schizophyllum commune H4-8]|nr:uncharacterized protein SCHCODRAFT_02548794 [Schizophyllum commune H4-8]KAI5889145.1 hypothetical protein SCHCODRAFT_02548794 [Schizophyllum commune H4-8]